MDKEDIIDILNRLPYSKEEYYVCGRSALVLYGIRHYCDHIHLYIGEELFQELISGKKINTSLVEEGFYRLDDEIAVSPKKKFECRKEEGLQLQNLKELVVEKKAKNEKEDQIDLEKIEAYIKKHHIKITI